jgi:predicted transcriptional regulator
LVKVHSSCTCEDGLDRTRPSRRAICPWTLAPERRTARYYTLKALRDRASAEQVEEAEIDAAIAEHEAWKAAGRPGLKSHEEFMAEVFGGSW